MTSKQRAKQIFACQTTQQVLPYFILDPQKLTWINSFVYCQLFLFHDKNKKTIVDICIQ